MAKNHARNHAAGDLEMDTTATYDAELAALDAELASMETGDDDADATALMVQTVADLAAIPHEQPETATYAGEHAATPAARAARAIVKHTDRTADTANNAVKRNAARAEIATLAIDLMIGGDTVESAAKQIAAEMEKYCAYRNISVPTVWTRLADIEHALKCWIPGMCNAVQLPNGWPSLARKPFYRLPERVMQRYLLNDGAYHSGLITDYFSRINPAVLTDVTLDRYDRLTANADRRSFLRALLDISGA